MKGWIKSITNDKYLSPIRKQLYDMIECGSDILEIGCGTGDFLVKAAQKINSGLGLDSSKSLVNYAIKKKDLSGLKNIEFKRQYITSKFCLDRAFDYSLASLFFHIPPQNESVKILQKLAEISKEVLIVGFTEPKTKGTKMALYFDQRFNQHYKNYKTYAKNGYIEGFIKKSGLEIIETLSTFDSVIKIFRLKSED